MLSLPFILAQPVHITYIYYSFESVTIEYEVEMAWEEYEYVQIYYITSLME